VLVERGTYAPFAVTHSGTATAPITIETTATSGAEERMPGGIVTPIATITIPAGSSTPAVAVSGQSNVLVTGFRLLQNIGASQIAISGSSHITFNSNYLARADSGPSTAPSVSVTSDSSYVTISRTQISAFATVPTVLIQGGSHETLTTNAVSGSQQGPGFVLEGTTSAAITSNTINSGCGADVSLTGGSTAASIENNIIGGLSDDSEGCNVPDSDATALLVDSSSTSGTVADYNYVSTDWTATPTLYTWAGVPYASAAAFQTATGQAAHDSSVTNDSANSAAPGELPSDVYSYPWIQGLDETVTGAGPYPYYSRGALAATDPLNAHNSPSWLSTWTVGVTGTLSMTITDSWGNTITECNYDFGDGTPSVTVPATAGVCGVSHSFSVAGKYAVDVWVSVSDGSKKIEGGYVTVAS